jgi:hypothetical protein
MAAIRCSSVIELLICMAALVLADGLALLACSFRDEFFALTGILPVTYLLALPAPFLMAGSRRARTVVDRGIMAVSSSYSDSWLGLILLIHTMNNLPSLPSSVKTARSKSVPSPRPLLMIISRLSSNTEIPVPSNSSLVGSFWDLNL